MLKYLDGTDLFNSLMLERSQRKSKVIVVEGESDLNLLADFLQNDHLEVVVGYGKQSLLEASQPALESLPEVVFLIDADFDHLTGNFSSYASNVVASDYYDLYMDAHFQDPKALLRVASQFLRSCDITPEMSIDISMAAAEAVGITRYVSELQCYNLNLSNFPVEMVMDKDDCGKIDLSGVIRLAIVRTKASSVSSDVLEQQIKSVRASVKRDQVINSHDLLAALRFICKQFGATTVAHKLDSLFELSVDEKVFLSLPVISRLEARLAA